MIFYYILFSTCFCILFYDNYLYISVLKIYFSSVLD